MDIRIIEWFKGLFSARSSFRVLRAGCTDNPLPCGRLVKNRFGKFIYIYRPIRINTNGKSIYDLVRLTPETVSLLTTCKKFENLHVKNILFLDIETTSLQATPEDNCVLVGLAFYRGGMFHLEQFFLTDVKYEKAMLHATLKRFKRFSYISGYNVKPFDVNYLKKLCEWHRLGFNFDTIDYLDMYVSARRFFKDRTPNCRLKTVTEWVFNEYRNDIPSYKIPEYWKNFITTKDHKYALKIIEHNRFDLVYIIRLFLWFFCRLREPYGYYFEDVEDQYAVLRLLNKYGKQKSL
ncbi:MAG TPA: ribonuclease H-like domain-containing protein [Candidatus Hydrogenedens sp.]|nr:ribonuclease H-like domain-containing protein [Candidatus Hydrogenedens sp.]